MSWAIDALECCRRCGQETPYMGGDDSEFGPLCADCRFDDDEEEAAGAAEGGDGED